MLYFSPLFHLSQDKDARGWQRECAYDEDDAKRLCRIAELQYSNPVVKCKTCDTDGCNEGTGDKGGASEYAPIAILFALPIAVAKIL